MNEQQKQEFLKKVKAAIDLETEIATQEEILMKYKQQAESMKPQLVQLIEPEKPEQPQIETDSWKNHPVTIGGGCSFLLLALIFVMHIDESDNFICQQ